MKYDPIMCMMVPEKVNTKDSAVNEYEIHYTVPGKGEAMVGSGRGSTEAEAKADFLRYHKSENPKITSVKFYKKVSDVKTKGESYVVRGKKYKVVRQDGDNVTVIGPDGKVTKMHIDFLKNEGIKTKDSNAIDKAITTCDKTELDPQDSRYIRKAIGSLKAANSLLGMINEGTVNKAKTNIANTISLLESID